MDIPQWLPDWRKEEDYPDPGKTEPAHWAWEFLRRNPDYQKDFQDHCGPFTVELTPSGDYTLISPDDPRLLKGLELSKLYGIHIMCDPARPYFENGTAQVVFNNIELAQPPCITVDDLPHPLPEKVDLTSAWDWGGDNPASELAETIRNILPQQVSEVTAKFDVSEPIEWQLKNIEEYLRLRQSALFPQNKTSNRNHWDRYRTYLRILDAEVAGVPDNEVAPILYPDTPNEYPDNQAIDTLKKARVAARECYKEKYKIMAAAQESPSGRHNIYLLLSKLRLQDRKHPSA
jgi:hypothetical protein